MVKLNLGCGLQCPEGWINIDSSFGVRISKFPFLKKCLYFIFPEKWKILPNSNWPSNTRWMDMTKPFSFSDNSIDVIYSSHTFEHLTYEEAQFAFSECYRILKPAGIIRIIVPDFEELVNAYLSDKAADPKNASMKFHKNSGYFELPVPNSFFGLMPFYFKRKNNHQFLYDEMALRKQFEAAGFREISRKRFQESEIQNIKEIDIEKRFANAICLEAKK